jgi:DNA-binding NtrC family response regulator
MAGLSQLNWPGNIRQLENAVYRAVVMSEGEQLGVSDFPLIGALPATNAEPSSEPLIMESVLQRASPDMVSGNEIPIAPLPNAASLTMLSHDGEMRPLEELEAAIIRFAISHYRGQMSEVARRLKIGRSTLYRKLDDLAVSEER